MKGYAYLSLDGNLCYKSAEYVDHINPGFWQENDAFILKIWKFDTEDLNSMIRMYQSFISLKLKNMVVLDFSKSIGFDVSTLRI